MIPDTDWEPSPQDILWQQNHVFAKPTQITIWAVPSTESVFTIDKHKKTFELSLGDSDAETNRRIAKVFKRMGFTEVGNKPPDQLDRFKSSSN